MKLPRDTALKFHFFFDQIVPPFLRDCRWLMKIPMRMAFGHHADTYLDFKQIAYSVSEEEFRGIYREVSDVAFERETDLNEESLRRIMEHVRGPAVLEVGCGKGYLACRLSADYQVTACDIVIQPQLREACKEVHFEEANAEALPFADQSFDTVISTHTLEHVRNVSRAVSELRRVAKRLILVVPHQRPYKYTFDLHLNFFPYPYSLLSAMGRIEGGVICEDAGGDLFYMEDVHG